MEAQTLEQIKDYIFDHLPMVLEKDPRFVVMIEGIVAEKFPRRDEFARMLDKVSRMVDDLHNLRISSEQRFEQIDQRFEQIDQRFEQIDQRFEQMENKMEAGFHDVHVHIDRLGSRWGIRNEKIFRQTMKEVLEGSIGMTVRERVIGGEQFDCIITNGQHILIEIAASVKPNIHERLIRKRELYTEETGIVPSRFLLAVGSIHSKRAEALRADGFEVIEPEE